MARAFSLTPKPVPPVETKYRKISTDLPCPQSIPVLEKLHKYELRAMLGQPPILWDRAEGFQIWDPAGNQWIDWSSGVLITNAGHSHPDVVDAIVKQTQKHVVATYMFPNEVRAQFCERFAELLPENHRKIFLLSTGSEAVECAIKLCRTHGAKAGGRKKNIIVSFEKAFHGRTLGSQQAGGIPALKEWIGNLDPGFVQVPFPDGYRTPDTSFDFFLRCLADAGVEAPNVAGVVLETYQGGSAAFAPVEYMQKLRQWCDAHKALLVCDEVQAGFGRTGTLWGFEHYGIVPDLSTWGKGITGSLPLAAVAGRPDVMDLHPPGSMSSTHTGSPVCAAAALASLEVILRENLAGNARTMGDLMHSRLKAFAAKQARIGTVAGKGLVAGVACVKPGSHEPDGDFAWDVVEACMEKGLLMFTPVGFGGATIKICPPLVINEEAMLESLAVFEGAFVEVASRVEAVAR
ncbi:MAG: aminotransferase class III-fold pyridoxal phosphate-dependent enzyme [Bryobacterales bacterium]|nr:aminotransferase class III-fold pyridoxal phosphate-dependent enzyme [Bryobacterales bacterium]